MTEDTWRERARSVIGEAWLTWVDVHGEKPTRSMPDSEKARFMTYLNAHYPFGERKMWPYKMWLSEMKKMREWLYKTPEPLDVNLFAPNKPDKAGLKDE